MAFTYTWDTTFGNAPADTDSRKYGAQEMRKHKDALTERLQVDHEFGEEVIGTGVDDQTDSGYHKRVTLKKVAGGPSEAASGYAEMGYNSTDDTIEYYAEGGTKRVLLHTSAQYGLLPIGSIIGLHPGVTIAKAVDTDYWIACDGVGTCTFTYPDGTTTTGVSVPDLTDNRFLMGGTSSGTGGSNTIVDHTHDCGDYDTSHTHSYTRYSTYYMNPELSGPIDKFIWDHTTSVSTGSGGGNHSHAIGNGSAPGSTDSRPLYFTVLYYMRIK